MPFCGFLLFLKSLCDPSKGAPYNSCTKSARTGHPRFIQNVDEFLASRRNSEAPRGFGLACADRDGVHARRNIGCQESAILKVADHTSINSDFGFPNSRSLREIEHLVAKHIDARLSCDQRCLRGEVRTACLCHAPGQGCNGNQ